MSITRRHDDSPLSSNSPAANRSAPEIEVRLCVAGEAAGDRRQHFRAGQRRGIALPLDLQLARRHRSRHVDGEHQLHVDLDRGGRPLRPPLRCGQGEG
jgi:hypothetical protein